jgi:hypothetical protein
MGDRRRLTITMTRGPSFALGFAYDHGELVIYLGPLCFSVMRTFPPVEANDGD